MEMSYSPYFHFQPHKLVILVKALVINFFHGFPIKLPSYYLLLNDAILCQTSKYMKSLGLIMNHQEEEKIDWIGILVVPIQLFFAPKWCNTFPLLVLIGPSLPSKKEKKGNENIERREQETLLSKNYP